MGRAAPRLEPDSATARLARPPAHHGRDVVACAASCSAPPEAERVAGTSRDLSPDIEEHFDAAAPERRVRGLGRDPFDDTDRQGRLDDAREAQITARKQGTKLFGRPFPAPRRHYQHIDVAHLNGAWR
jgi:hypothetical protein